MSTLIERFEAKVVRCPMSGCHLWMGGVTSFGYGVIWAKLSTEEKARLVMAHRVAYDLYVGPIPAGAEICHRCDNPPCVNPYHLFPGPHVANMHDMWAKGRGKESQTRKTHCPRGHEYSGANLLINCRGARECRACNALKAAKHRKALRAA